VSFATTRAQYLQALVDNLASRFPDIELLKAISQLFDLDALIKLQLPQQRRVYGRDALKPIIAHFAQTRPVDGANSPRRAVLDVTALPEEFSAFKLYAPQSLTLAEKIAADEVAAKHSKGQAGPARLQVTLTHILEVLLVDCC